MRLRIIEVYNFVNFFYKKRRIFLIRKKNLVRKKIRKKKGKNCKKKIGKKIAKNSKKKSKKTREKTQKKLKVKISFIFNKITKARKSLVFLIKNDFLRFLQPRASKEARSSE